MVDLEFGLIVTGVAEEKALPSLFRPLFEYGLCSVQVWQRIGQLGPRKEVKAPRLPGHSVGRVPKLDEELAQKTRNWLCDQNEGWKPWPKRRLILIDDLEHDRRDRAEQVFNRYREALHLLLDEEVKKQSAVHFLANMLEAYFWADPRGLKERLGIESSQVGIPPDPESIRHPKNLILEELQKLKAGRSYREIDDGIVLLGKVDLVKVLGDPQTCGYLRAAVRWMVDSLERATSQLEVLNDSRLREKYRLDDGILAAATRDQPVA